VWRHAGVPRFLFGLGTAVLASNIWLIALGWTAGKLPNSLDTSLVMAAATVPRAVLLLVGGTIVDRVGPARVAAISQFTRLILVAVIGPILLLAGSSLVVLLPLALIFGAVDAVYLPAASSLPPLLMPPEDLPAGQGIVQTLERAASFVGAPLGGVVASLGGLPLACAVNAVFYLVALLAFRQLPLTRQPGPAAVPQPGPAAVPQPAPATGGEPEGQATSGEPETQHGPEIEHIWAGLRSGLSYAGSEPRIWAILLVVTVLNLALSGAINVGLVLSARQHHWGANGFAWTIAAFGAAAAIGALSLTRIRPQRRPALVGLVWVIVGAACVGGLAVTTQLVPAIALVAGLGFAAGPASALLLGIVQASTRPAFLGRVMSLMTFSSLGLVPLSYTGFGALSAGASLPAAYLTSAAVTAATAIVAITVRTVRQAQLSAVEVEGAGRG
jgi:predicted MFS family arabinose efflux permease